MCHLCSRPERIDSKFLYGSPVTSVSCDISMLPLARGTILALISYMYLCVYHSPQVLCVLPVITIGLWNTLSVFDLNFFENLPCFNPLLISSPKIYFCSVGHLGLLPSQSFSTDVYYDLTALPHSFWLCSSFHVCPYFLFEK